MAKDITTGSITIRSLWNGHDIKIKSVYDTDTQTFLWKSAHPVTYHIDSNSTQVVEIEDGQDAIAGAPTASKSGYLFIGWRQDTQPSDSTLRTKTITSDDVHLYAVFRRAFVLSYDPNGGNTTPDSQTGYQYYNNGRSVNPTLTVTAAIQKSNNIASNGVETYYIFASWSGYSPNTSITLTQNTQLQAQWTDGIAKYWIVKEGRIFDGWTLKSLAGTVYSSANSIRFDYNNRLIQLTTNLKSAYPNRTLKIRTAITDHVGSYGRINSSVLCLTASNFYDTHSMNSDPNFADIILPKSGGQITVATNNTNTTIAFNTQLYAGNYVSFNFGGYADGGYQDLYIGEMYIE